MKIIYLIFKNFLLLKETPNQNLLSDSPQQLGYPIFVLFFASPSSIFPVTLFFCDNFTKCLSSILPFIIAIIFLLLFRLFKF